MAGYGPRWQGASTGMYITSPWKAITSLADGLASALALLHAASFEPLFFKDGIVVANEYIVESAADEKLAVYASRCTFIIARTCASSGTVRCDKACAENTDAVSAWREKSWGGFGWWAVCGLVPSWTSDVGMVAWWLWVLALYVFVRCTNVLRHVLCFFNISTLTDKIWQPGDTIKHHAKAKVLGVQAASKSHRRSSGGTKYNFNFMLISHRKNQSSSLNIWWKNSAG